MTDLSKAEKDDLAVNGLYEEGTAWQTLTSREISIFMAGMQYAQRVIREAKKN
jgi:hypothetical protein